MGGLRGRGFQNALSEWCEAEVHRDNQHYKQEYKIGIAQTPINKLGNTDKRGTKITFKPDYSVFVGQTYSPEIIKNRLRELSFLNSGIKINFKHNGEKEEFLSDGGLLEFVNYLDKNHTHIFDTPIH